MRQQQAPDGTCYFHGVRLSWIGWLHFSHCQQPPELFSLMSVDIPGMRAVFEVPASLPCGCATDPSQCPGMGSDLRAAYGPMAAGSITLRSSAVWKNHLSTLAKNTIKHEPACCSQLELAWLAQILNLLAVFM